MMKCINYKISPSFGADDSNGAIKYYAAAKYIQIVSLFALAKLMRAHMWVCGCADI